jgi:hypothetical protein
MNLTEKIVAIVVFKQQREEVERFQAMRDAGHPVPVPRLVFYQVTLDPNQISPSGQYIRIGDTQGDEILGWQPVESLEIIETLAKFDGANLVTIPRGESNEQR